MKLLTYPHVVLLFAAALLTGCGGPVVSPSDQSLIQQADDLHARLRPAVVEDRDPKLKRYFEQIAGRVTAAAKELDQQHQISSSGSGGGSNDWMFSRDIDFHLVDNDELNAFASGGKHVYLYTGLFQQCRTEDELAAQLCHQFAHLYGRHVQQSIKRDPSLTGENALLIPFATLRHTAALERAADAVAFGVFARAGWDPGQFASLDQRLLEQNAPGVDRYVLREKVIEAQRRADALPPAAREWAQPPVADEARFPQLQAEARNATGLTPRNTKTQLLLAAFPLCLGQQQLDTPAQQDALARLFPPPPASSDNKWEKGIHGR